MKQTLIIALSALTVPVIYSRPFQNLFESRGGWLDRLPSIEVKFKPDGISVATGPSREELYWLIGYSVVGSIVLITILVLLGVCICKLCCANNNSRRGSANSLFSGPFYMTEGTGSSLMRMVQRPDRHGGTNRLAATHEHITVNPMPAQNNHSFKSKSSKNFSKNTNQSSAPHMEAGCSSAPYRSTN